MMSIIGMPVGKFFFIQIRIASLTISRLTWRSTSFRQGGGNMRFPIPFDEISPFLSGFVAMQFLCALVIAYSFVLCGMSTSTARQTPQRFGLLCRSGVFNAL
ncbi:hypothetical protein [Cupriavidus sp. TMH.W2]|uniref:hypothetical protein n=1 Tax=Cupriavidus sp. TMH.W2 TaxID=3434465 RepID=UPI003D783E1A